MPSKLLDRSLKDTNNVDRIGEQLDQLLGRKQKQERTSRNDQDNVLPV